MNAIRTVLGATALAVGLSGVAHALEPAQAWDREGWPDVVRIGVLPEEDVAVMEERYQPLRAHFEEVLGVDVELFFGTDFTAMVEAMRFGNIEVSKFGPFSYILAADRANAEAIVQGARYRAQPTYQSYIITRDDSGIEEPKDLEGRSFAWVDPASTSGYLFPRAHLIRELGVDNEAVDAFLGTAIYAGGHDAAVRAVINGDVDAAAVSDSQVQRMQAAEVDGIDRVRVVTETLPIPRSPEAVRGDLPESLKLAISYAYLSFNDEAFLTAHNYHEGFIPVTDAAYDVVRDTASALGLAPEDLL
jgi:phosphonate transport system substrate-binding protein